MDYFIICTRARYFKKFEKWSTETTKISVLQVAIYFFYLSLLTTVLALPMQWIGRKVSVDYGISTQSTQSWIKDHVIDFWVNYATMLLIYLQFFYGLSVNSRRDGG